MDSHDLLVRARDSLAGGQKADYLLAEIDAWIEAHPL